MEWVTYNHPSFPNQMRAGIRVGNSILEVAASGGASPLLTIIENSEKFLPLAKKIETDFKAGKLPADKVIPESAAQILSPLPRPVSIRDGYAFRQHVESLRRSRGLPMIPEFDLKPTFYFSNALNVTGPGPVSVDRKSFEKIDFELEVAIVIGKQGRNIRADQADDYIFGYMIMNDWSDRDIWLNHESKLSLGPAKSKDFATSFGPYLVTRESLAARRIPSSKGERYDLTMTASVNGKKYSEGNLKDMTWTFAEIIEHASDGVTLYPGEVIGSGTVGTGCFAELNAAKITDGIWLKHSDEIELSVECLGTLKNQILRVNRA